MGPGHFRGPGTQLVGANGAPLHVPPGTQLVDTIEPRSASRSCIDIACEADGLKHILRRLKPNGQQKLKNLKK
eukprot:jgi/Tetstr1/428453/TSEL_018466.t1